MRRRAGGPGDRPLLGGTELEEVAASRAESLVIDGVRVPVCAPTDLAIGKMIAGRPLDLSKP